LQQVIFPRGYGIDIHPVMTTFRFRLQPSEDLSLLRAEII
jgi:hypothetical protein